MKAESPDSASLVVDVKARSPSNEDEMLMQVDDQSDSDRGERGQVSGHTLNKPPGSTSPTELRLTSANIAEHSVSSHRVQNHTSHILQIKTEGTPLSKEDTHMGLKAELKTEPIEADAGPSAGTPSGAMVPPSTAHTGTL